jgi:hypothetical protein
MVDRFSSSLLFGLIVGLAALTIAGCRATQAGPTAAVAENISSPSPTPVGTLTVPAGDQPEQKPTAVGATAADVQGENGELEETPDSDDETTAAETLAAGEAANADVTFVRATLEAGGSWRFDVTVRHPDTGWEDYADGWDVMTPDGLVLKVDESDPFTRLLLDPHENEQPFTRSQRGIMVPEGVTVVTVQAHDLVDGFGGREVRVDLLSDGGDDYEVIRE